MLEEFDPNSIEDERVRQAFISMMNVVEMLSAKVAEQAEEIQHWRDEVNRLKGEQGCTLDQGKQANAGSLLRETPSRKQTSSKEQQTGKTQD